MEGFFISIAVIIGFIVALLPLVLSAIAINKASRNKALANQFLDLSDDLNALKGRVKTIQTAHFKLEETIKAKDELINRLSDKIDLLYAADRHEAATMAVAPQQEGQEPPQKTGKILTCPPAEKAYYEIAAQTVAREAVEEPSSLVTPPATLPVEAAPETQAQPLAGIIAGESAIQDKAIAVAPAPTASENDYAEPSTPMVAVQIAAREAPKERAKPLNIEELIGTQVLPKLGMVIVVIGMVFFLAYAMTKLGPLGKVGIGVLAGAALLGGGLFTERKDRYKVFGRAMIAGGFGILYFVAFATHFITASRLINSPILAGALLMAVAACAVGFSLRYNNEWTTIFSFALIYVSLFCAAVYAGAGFNTIATAVSAVAISFLAWRYAWQKLLLISIPAAWVIIGAWMLPTATSSAAFGPTYLVFLGLLTIWAAFQAAYLFSRDKGSQDKVWHTVAFVLNGLMALALCLAFAKITMLVPLYTVPMAFGCFYLASAWHLRRSSRRLLYLIAATLGLIALGLVSPLKYGFNNPKVPFLRIIGIEGLLVIGVYLKERYFRVLAYLAMVFTFLQIIITRLNDSTFTLFGLMCTYRLALLGEVAFFCLITIWLIHRSWHKVLDGAEHATVLYTASAMAGLSLLLAIGLEIWHPWIGCTMAMLGLIWLGCARRFKLSDFFYEGVVILAVALIAIFAHNMPYADQVVTLPWMSALGLAIIAYYGAYLVSLSYKAHLLQAEMSGLARVLPYLLSPVFSLLLAILIWRTFPATWAGPAMGLVGLVWVVKARRFTLNDIFYLGLLLLAVAFCLVVQNNIFYRSSYASNQETAPALILVFEVFVAYLVLRYYRLAPIDPALSKTSWSSYLPFALSAATALLLALVLQRTLDPPFIGPAIALLALCWLFLCRRFALEDFALEALGLALWAVISALVAYDQPQNAIALSLTALAIAVSYLVSRFYESSSGRPLWARSLINYALSAMALVIVTVFICLKAEAILITPLVCLTIFAIVLLGLRFSLEELFAWGLLWSAVAVAALAIVAFRLTGAEIYACSPRLISVSGALIAIFCTQWVLERYARQTSTPLPYLEPDQGRAGYFYLAYGYLLLPTATLLWLIKAEALAYDKNLLFALVAGFIGVVYVECSRAKRSAFWFALGHAIVAMACTHLFTVNFLQEGSLGPFSLRLATVLPFFGFLVYLYNTYHDAVLEITPSEKVLPYGIAYLYASTGTLALLLLYELHRAWVVLGWAIMALAMLLWGLHKNRWHWQLIALLLAVSVTTRGFGINLYYRDSLDGLYLNWIALPVAITLLLAGYILLRRHQLRTSSRNATWPKIALISTALHYDRLIWLFCAVALITSYIWIEAHDTVHSIWLSVLGMSLIALGLAFKERSARLTGLTILSFCIGKLFFYDLRGLEGLARIFSFIVPGIILMIVGWAYLRFKERLKDLL